MRDPIEFHRMLLRSEERMTAYRAAIQAVVRPGDVVLDVGTGSGILAFFACQAGAARVYAVERSDAILLARKLAEANGFADRIIFLRQDVADLELPEAVDVITSELVSKAVIGQKMAETIGRCRDRFLKPGGRIVPEQVALLLAPVEAPESYQRLAFPEQDAFGIDFQPAETWAYNQTVSLKMAAESLLAPGSIAYEYEARNAPWEDAIRAHICFEIETAATMHGYCAWFAARLATDGSGAPVLLSNHPPGIGAWDNLFFPLPRPVAVEPGAQIELRLNGNDTSQTPLFWVWRTRVLPPQAGAKPASLQADRILEFTQSTMQGQLLSAAGWDKRAGSFVPDLNERGQCIAFVLRAMQERQPLAAIAEELRLRFPHRYAQQGQALAFVADLSEQYSA